MIGASDLNRIVPVNRAGRDAALARYARSELNGASLAWAVPAPAARTPWTLGVRIWLAARLRGPAPHTPAAEEGVRTGLRAVPVSDAEVPSIPMHRPSERSRPDLLAASALILVPAAPCRETDGVTRDEA